MKATAALVLSVIAILAVAYLYTVELPTSISYAVGPYATASKGGVAVGIGATATGPGAVAIGDYVKAKTGEIILGDTLFDMPMEKILGEEGQEL